MTTAVVYHTFSMPFSMQRGRPLKFVVYHRVVLGVKKQHYIVAVSGVACFWLLWTSLFLSQTTPDSSHDIATMHQERYFLEMEAQAMPIIFC